MTNNTRGTTVTESPSAMAAARRDSALKATVVEHAAMLAHEANRWYCATMGEGIQPSWTEAPDWQVASAVLGARAIWDNPKLTPEEIHQIWLELKHADGWQYGETKDAEAKRHPCMVPYEELPPEQRAKDAVFGAVVRSAFALLECVHVCSPTRQADHE